MPFSSRCFFSSVIMSLIHHALSHSLCFSVFSQTCHDICFPPRSQSIFLLEIIAYSYSYSNYNNNILWYNITSILYTIGTNKNMSGKPAWVGELSVGKRNMASKLQSFGTGHKREAHFFCCCSCYALLINSCYSVLFNVMSSHSFVIILFHKRDAHVCAHTSAPHRRVYLSSLSLHRHAGAFFRSAPFSASLLAQLPLSLLRATGVCKHKHSKDIFK